MHPVFRAVLWESVVKRPALLSRSSTIKVVLNEPGLSYSLAFQNLFRLVKAIRFAIVVWPRHVAAQDLGCNHVQPHQEPEASVEISPHGRHSKPTLHCEDSPRRML